MPKIIEQKFEIGTDAYGRRVTMTRHQTYDGKIMWRIRSDQMDVRDTGEDMDGLTDENIRQMIRALDLLVKP
jgi:hypothetical protein